MKRTALVFSTVPHGITVGRESLDALLATLVSTDNLAVFFIADGVLQPLPGQKPDTMLAHDYIATFRLLGPHDIEQCWVYAAPLRERKLDPQTPFVVKATPSGADALRRELVNYGAILRF